MSKYLIFSEGYYDYNEISCIEAPVLTAYEAAWTFFKTKVKDKTPLEKIHYSLELTLDEYIELLNKYLGDRRILGIMEVKSMPYGKIESLDMSEVICENS